MSVDSGLIVRRDALPTPAELASATQALTGVAVTFPADLHLADWSGGWVPMTVDGQDSGFELYPGKLSDADELPEDASTYGDTLLWFVARGPLSAETVSLLQRVLADGWNAAGLIENEIFPPSELAKESVPPEDMDPDLAATMVGTPAERAAATERYVAKFYPPQPPAAPLAQAKSTIQQLILPILILLVLGGLYLWSRFQ